MRQHKILRSQPHLDDALAKALEERKDKRSAFLLRRGAMGKRRIEPLQQTKLKWRTDLRQANLELGLGGAGIALEGSNPLCWVSKGAGEREW